MPDDTPAFQYVVEPLPPSRLGRRWRWQLYRGERLVAGGWRHGERGAMLAIRIAASRAAHELFGVVPLRPELAVVDRPLRPGTTAHLSMGAIACLLVPRPVDRSAGERAAA